MMMVMILSMVTPHKHQLNITRIKPPCPKHMQSKTHAVKETHAVKSTCSSKAHAVQKHMQSHTALHTQPFTHSSSHTALHTQCFTHSPSHTALHTQPFTHSASHAALHTQRFSTLGYCSNSWGVTGPSRCHMPAASAPSLTSVLALGTSRYIAASLTSRALYRRSTTPVSRVRGVLKGTSCTCGLCVCLGGECCCCGKGCL